MFFYYHFHCFIVYSYYSYFRYFIFIFIFILLFVNIYFSFIISHIILYFFLFYSFTYSQVEFIYSILSNLTQQCPNGQLLDKCLSHFLKIIQGNEKYYHEKLSFESIKENKKDVNSVNDNFENDKNEDRVLKEHEHSQRKIAALDVISDLFLSEIENEFNKETTSSTHVHTSSCNHDHHNDVSVKR